MVFAAMSRRVGPFSFEVMTGDLHCWMEVLSWRDNDWLCMVWRCNQ